MKLVHLVWVHSSTQNLYFFPRRVNSGVANSSTISSSWIENLSALFKVQMKLLSDVRFKNTNKCSSRSFLSYIEGRTLRVVPPFLFSNVSLTWENFPEIGLTATLGILSKSVTFPPDSHFGGMSMMVITISYCL